MSRRISAPKGGASSDYVLKRAAALCIGCTTDTSSFSAIDWNIQQNAQLYVLACNTPRLGNVSLPYAKCGSDDFLAKQDAALCRNCCSTLSCPAGPPGPPGRDSLQTAAVVTTGATPTSLALIAIPEDGVLTFSGMVNAASLDYTTAIGGRLTATAHSALSATPPIAPKLVAAEVVNNSTTTEATFNADVSGGMFQLYVQGLSGETMHWFTEYTYTTLTSLTG